MAAWDQLISLEALGMESVPADPPARATQLQSRDRCGNTVFHPVCRLADCDQCSRLWTHESAATLAVRDTGRGSKVISLGASNRLSASWPRWCCTPAANCITSVASWSVRRGLGRRVNGDLHERAVWCHTRFADGAGGGSCFSVCRSAVWSLRYWSSQAKRRVFTGPP